MDKSNFSVLSKRSVSPINYIEGRGDLPTQVSLHYKTAVILTSQKYLKRNEPQSLK